MNTAKRVKPTAVKETPAEMPLLLLCPGIVGAVMSPVKTNKTQPNVTAAAEK
jgi:hypothetical protein